MPPSSAARLAFEHLPRRVVRAAAPPLGKAAGIAAAQGETLGPALLELDSSPRPVRGWCCGRRRWRRGRLCRGARKKEAEALSRLPPRRPPRPPRGSVLAARTAGCHTGRWAPCRSARRPTGREGRWRRSSWKMPALGFRGPGPGAGSSGRRHCWVVIEAQPGGRSRVWRFRLISGSGHARLAEVVAHAAVEAGAGQQREAAVAAAALRSAFFWFWRRLSRYSKLKVQRCPAMARLTRRSSKPHPAPRHRPG